MRVKPRIALALMLLAATLSSPTQLHAEEQSASQAAVRLGYEGLSFYQEGQWLEAHARFKQADASAHSPVFVLYMARCQRNLGRLREAAAQLEELLAEPRARGAPASWENALRDGRAELEVLRLRLPSVRISGRDTARATVDDAPVRLDELVPLNPGAHVVRGWSSDGRLVVRSVTLDEGEQQVPISLSLSLPPVEPGTSTAAPPAANHDAATARPRAWRTAAWVSGGAAVGSALLGTITGLMAKSKLDSVRQHCDGSRCPEQYQPDAESARRLANLSTAAFGVAGLNAVFSVTFVLLPNGALQLQ